MSLRREPLAQVRGRGNGKWSGVCGEGVASSARWPPVLPTSTDVTSEILTDSPGAAPLTGSPKSLESQLLFMTTILSAILFVSLTSFDPPKLMW